MLKIITATTILILSVFLFGGCKDEENSNDKFTPPGPVTGFKSVDKFKVTLYNSREISIGYNSFFVHLVDTVSNSVVMNATMVIKAVEPGTIATLAPFEKTQISESAQVYFNGLILDTATDEEVARAIQISFFVPGITRQLVVEIPVTVLTSSRLDVQKTYTISLVNPEKPQRGRNFFEFVVFTNSTGLPFSNGLSSTFEWTGPNSVVYQPVNGTEISAAGHYTSTIEFGSSGIWTLKLSLIKENSTLVTSTFYINVK